MSIIDDDDKVQKTYLGDGLYAEFDGYQFKLYTDRDGLPPTTRHEVYLDRYVLDNFLTFVKCAT